MQINIALLELYSKKNGMSVTTNIDIESPSPTLRFIKGKDKDGTRVEYLDFSDLYDILVINNVLGANGLLIQERDRLTNDLKSGLGNRNNREKKMEFLVYDTMSKYIIQMLSAGFNKIYFPSIIPIPKHKDIYFRESIED